MNNLICMAINTSSNTGAAVLQIAYVLVLCILIFVGAYYTSRFIANLQNTTSKASNMKILEAISLGPQKTLQLIKIGKEYILIGVSKDTVTFVKEISEEKLDKELFESKGINDGFAKHLENFMKKNKTENSENSEKDK